MKRIMMFALAAVTALSIGMTGTLAAGAGMGRNFSDTDGDGICDYFAVCHNAAPSAYGANYIDADGDGVCDHFANRPYRQGGRGSGFHGRHNNR